MNQETTTGIVHRHIYIYIYISTDFLTIYRIVVPNTELHLVLTDNGSSRDGTSIGIADKSSEKNQLWKLKWIKD